MSFTIKLLLLVFLFPVTLFAYTENNPRILVGYIDYTSSDQPSLVEAVNNGYNFIIIGFMDVDGAKPPKPDPKHPKCKNINLASLDKIQSVYKTELKSRIKAAKESGAKVLITVGGQNNTFNPPQDASAIELANCIYYEVINKYEFSGIDFDLETPQDPILVKDIIIELKNLNEDIIISGAPQASVWWKDGSGTVSFLPSYWGQLVSATLKPNSKIGIFDYIMLQVYNQAGGVQYYLNGDKKLGPSSPGIYAALYDLYKTQITIPSNTKLIIGAPSDSGAGTGLSDPGCIKKDIDCIINNNSCVNDLKLHKKYSDFPGIMTWSIGNDAKDTQSSRKPYAFSNGVKPCLQDPKNNCNAGKDSKCNTQKAEATK